MTATAVPERVRTAKTGAAITALVLGVVALCGSPLPILNNATIIAGFLGVGFGVVALYGAHRTVALIGMALAIGGIVLGLSLQAQWSAELDRLRQDVDKSVSCIEQAATPQDMQNC